jgi:integrase
LASIKQRSSGSWQAKVRRQGYPEQSRTFDRKTDAEAWARSVERDMDVGAFVSRREAENTSFGEAVDRYIRECIPKLRAQRQPTSMLAKLRERFGEYSLVAIQPAMLAAYRDERLQLVGPQTVKHELGLITRVFKACQMDWGIPIPQGIPTAGIRKPKLPPGRTRRLQGDEETLLLAGIDPSKSPWFKAAFTLAIETAARQSELLSMSWADVDLENGFVRLRGMHGRETKNGQVYREVPLSEQAVEVLQALPKSATGSVLPISASALDSAWDRLTCPL